MSMRPPGRQLSGAGPYNKISGGSLYTHPEVFTNRGETPIAGCLTACSSFSLVTHCTNL